MIVHVVVAWLRAHYPNSGVRRPLPPTATPGLIKRVKHYSMQHPVKCALMLESIRSYPLGPNTAVVSFRSIMIMSTRRKNGERRTQYRVLLCRRAIYVMGRICCEQHAETMCGQSRQILQSFMYGYK